MRDLNDFRYFEAVVRNAGFNAASRDLGVSKSTLSRRILALEQDLGVRLIERTTHSFSVTAVGNEFYEKCRVAVTELESAEMLATAMSAEPRGLVTVACLPGACAATLGAGLPDFLDRYPKVKIRMVIGQRRFDLAEEHIDVAIRGSRLDQPGDGDLVIKRIADIASRLVASPQYLARAGSPSTPEEISRFATIARDAGEAGETEVWRLVHRSGEARTVRIEPRIVAQSLAVHAQAVKRGGGIALLPEPFTAGMIRSGELVRVLPAWAGEGETLHIAFTSRRAMLPAVRVFIDFAHAQLRGLLRGTCDSLADFVDAA
ncbi:LysR substrate-binding domain-containing protein [Jiella pacifica]|uniref:LysR family transcriptional regulator n=1 Tax=Jiella pacifica TaxID=2696469 RepID=A0A6N9T6K1_9HYPH|nr:LysR substrate-binding domain-containing protein [Jiella pacifica]NDW07013.1 LysR family transcriptional regulator [Jiella pacifica]